MGRPEAQWFGSWGPDDEAPRREFTLCSTTGAQAGRRGSCSVHGGDACLKQFVAKVDPRSLAVEIVDFIHGHTMEFSNSPNAHEREYDWVERRLRGEVTDAD